jgi:CheY-like chemotaxis protein
MLLVGSFEPYDEAEARRVGADDYLTKPFQSIRTLIGKVGTLLSGGSAGSEEATTRQLAPPPEAAKENRPDEEFLARSTADTVPLSPEVREALQQAGSSRSRAGSLDDLSMDDQMIEETPANNFGGQAAPEAQPHHARPTAQYSAADLREAGLTPPFESAGAAAAEMEVTASSAYAHRQASEPPPIPASTDQSPLNSNQGLSQATSDDSLLDLGDLETPQALTEADDFFLDLLDEPPPEARPSTPPAAAAVANTEPPAAGSAAPAFAAEERDAAARADYEEDTVEVALPVTQGLAGEELPGHEERSQPASHDEAPSLFGADQIADSSFSLERQETSSDIQMAPTERLPGDFQLSETPRPQPSDSQSGAAVSASPATNQITLEQLSPEVIETIARRVVELLSARVIEQVAWEVVPDMAELLIKRRLDEKSGQ